MYYIINNEIQPLTEQDKNKENIINIYKNGGQIISNKPFSLILEELNEDILYTFDEDNQEYIDITIDDNKISDLLSKYGFNDEMIIKNEKLQNDIIYGNKYLISKFPFNFSYLYERDVRDYFDNPEILIYKENGIPTGYLRGYESPQLVLPKGNIRLKKVSEIHSLQLKGNDEDELIKIVFSIDDGNTWYAKRRIEDEYSNIEVNINDLDNVKELGMTIKEFNEINENWTQEVIKGEKIRFAYYLEKGRKVSEVDKLEIKLSMYGSWESQRFKDNNKIGYTNENIIVTITENGTYKVNYQA